VKTQNKIKKQELIIGFGFALLVLFISAGNKKETIKLPQPSQVDSEGVHILKDISKGICKYDHLQKIELSSSNWAFTGHVQISVDSVSASTFGNLFSTLSNTNQMTIYRDFMAYANIFDGKKIKAMDTLIQVNMGQYTLHCLVFNASLKTTGYDVRYIEYRHYPHDASKNFCVVKYDSIAYFYNKDDNNPEWCADRLDSIQYFRDPSPWDWLLLHRISMEVQYN
jgi:hypothetical protein